jgi:hypothetical protein
MIGRSSLDEFCRLTQSDPDFWLKRARKPMPLRLGYNPTDSLPAQPPSQKAGKRLNLFLTFQHFSLAFTRRYGTYDQVNGT